MKSVLSIAANAVELTAEMLLDETETSNLKRIRHCGKQAMSNWVKGNTWFAEGAKRAAIHMHMYGDKSALENLMYTKGNDDELYLNLPDNVNSDSILEFFKNVGVITGWKLDEQKFYVTKEAKRHTDILTSTDDAVVACRDAILSFTQKDVAKKPKAKDFRKGLKSTLWNQVKLFHSHTDEDTVPTQETIDTFANFCISQGACSLDDYTKFWNDKAREAGAMESAPMAAAGQF